MRPRKNERTGEGMDSIFFLFCEWIGTAAFAVSGAMVAVDKHTDIFGVLFLAIITALGGGTLRDMIIGHCPPRMFTNYHYLLMAAVCAVAVFVLARIYKVRYVRSEKLIEQINNVFDAIGLGIFAVSGARIGMEAGFAQVHLSSPPIGEDVHLCQGYAANRREFADIPMKHRATSSACLYHK